MCTCILIIALSVKIDTFNIYDYNLIYNQQFNNNICTQTFLKKKMELNPTFDCSFHTSCHNIYHSNQCITTGKSQVLKRRWLLCMHVLQNELAAT